MEDGTVEIAVLGIFQKILDGYRRFLGIEFDHYAPGAGLHFDRGGGVRQRGDGEQGSGKQGFHEVSYRVSGVSRRSDNAVRKLIGTPNPVMVQ